ncbi:MAG: hypothetical protein AAGD09_25260 [Cyanobacteria bacterium P01_F01_bin.56]
MTVANRARIHQQLLAYSYKSLTHDATTTKATDSKYENEDLVAWRSLHSRNFILAMTVIEGMEARSRADDHTLERLWVNCA